MVITNNLNAVETVAPFPTFGMVAVGGRVRHSGDCAGLSLCSSPLGYPCCRRGMNDIRM